jgi:hypothetical protein
MILVFGRGMIVWMITATSFSPRLNMIRSPNQLICPQLKMRVRLMTSVFFVFVFGSAFRCIVLYISSFLSNLVISRTLIFSWGQINWFGERIMFSLGLKLVAVRRRRRRRSFLGRRPESFNAHPRDRRCRHSGDANRLRWS